MATNKSLYWSCKCVYVYYFLPSQHSTKLDPVWTHLLKMTRKEYLGKTGMRPYMYIAHHALQGVSSLAMLSRVFKTILAEGCKDTLTAALDLPPCDSLLLN